MTLGTKLSNAAVNAQAAALNTLLSHGTITIYDGMQPATADTAVSANTAGVILTLATTAFAISNGVMTANAVTPGTATATIIPTWARIKTSAGATVFDVSAGASGCNLSISGIDDGATVSCTGFVHTVNKYTTGL